MKTYNSIMVSKIELKINVAEEIGKLIMLLLMSYALLRQIPIPQSRKCVLLVLKKTLSLCCCCKCRVLAGRIDCEKFEFNEAPWRGEEWSHVQPLHSLVLHWLSCTTTWTSEIESMREKLTCDWSPSASCQADSLTRPAPTVCHATSDFSLAYRGRSSGGFSGASRRGARENFLL